MPRFEPVLSKTVCEKTEVRANFVSRETVAAWMPRLNQT